MRGSVHAARMAFEVVNVMCLWICNCGCLSQPVKLALQSDMLCECCYHADNVERAAVHVQALQHCWQLTVLLVNAVLRCKSARTALRLTQCAQAGHMRLLNQSQRGMSAIMATSIPYPYPSYPSYHGPGRWLGEQRVFLLTTVARQEATTKYNCMG